MNILERLQHLETAMAEVLTDRLPNDPNSGFEHADQELDLFRGEVQEIIELVKNS